MVITKVKEGYLDVPIVLKEDIIQRGLYTLKYKNKVVKVGCYGEGVNSNNYSRFAAYRNKGKNIIPGNGSYKTMKVLNEKLEVGDIVEVTFIELPQDRYFDGYWWKVDLYAEEQELKSQNSNTLWLS
jgi:hypothetical protein